MCWGREREGNLGAVKATLLVVEEDEEEERWRRVSCMVELGWLHYGSGGGVLDGDEGGKRG